MTKQPHSSNDSAAADRVTRTVDQNPLALLVGGVAVGLLIGAMLPRTQREREVIGPLGKRLTDSAAAAAKAARDAGREELDALLPDRDTTRDRLTQVVGSVAGAARDAVRQN